VASPPSAALAPAARAGRAAGTTRCGAGDRPETGAVSGEVPLADQLSGRSLDGYSCNLRWVGGTALAGGDTQMTWYRDCAYRAVPPPAGSASDAVAVLDVRDPAHPRRTALLQDPRWAGQGGILNVHEGLHASERAGILVVPAGRFLTTYDVHGDCRHPKRLSTFDTGLPRDLVSQTGASSLFHSGQLSPDGTFFYGTTTGVQGFVAPFGPCLTIVDLLDPAHPKLVTRWGGGFPCHDLGFDASGDRVYVGTYTTVVGHPAAVLGSMLPLGVLSSLLTGMAVLDVRQIAHRTGSHIQQLGYLAGGDQHTQTPVTIRSRHYVIGAEEAFCPYGNGRIVDVEDPNHPVQVSKVELGVNQPRGCPSSVLEGEKQENLLLYMSHYVSVDDPSDATLAFFSWYASGLRVFDIRDPQHPREVAYFNPPVAGLGRRHDSTTTYPRYVPETGQVWVGSSANAFWVAELEPRLRPEALRGTATPWSADARAGGPSASYLRTVARVPVRAPTGFCTLAPVASTT
jgi:hypothetical protein